MPDESARDYRRNLMEWIDALKPNTAPESGVVAELADTAWRLRRLSWFESRRIDANLNEQVKESPMVGKITEARYALAALQSLDRAITQTAPPYQATAVEGLVAAAKQLLATLETFDDLPVIHIAAFERAIEVVGARTGDLDTETFTRLAVCARKITTALKAQIRKFEGEVEALRTRLAEDAALLPEKDARTIERVRKSLEQSFLRQLDLYDGVRKRARAAADEEGSGSFRSPLGAPPVRLRVIK
jgi:hypothetical protein